MKIGILSDTHNNLENLEKALDRFRQEEITTIIHCGDLTDASLARRMTGFRVICVLGNGDYASGEIRNTLMALNPENYCGLIYKGSIDGVQIAATHGHLDVVDELLASGVYTYVFKGHSHYHKDELHGSTRLINPGALGGLRRENRQFCILDLATGKAQFVVVI